MTLGCGIFVIMECKVEGCNKEVRVRRFCLFHYYRDKQGIPLSWPYNKRYHMPTKKIKAPIRICIVEGCEKKHEAKGYCSFHNSRLKRGISFSRPKGIKGNLNRHWNGGTSDYPNHHQMKKNRLIKIDQEKGKCEICKRKATQAHHKDRDKTNHTIDNLKLLCVKCHRRAHRGQKHHKTKTSIWIRRYGMTVKELSKTLRCSYPTLIKWHEKGNIAYFLHFESPARR